MTINSSKYYGDALVTVDGAVRLYVGGVYAGDGSVQTTRPENSGQFIANVGPLSGDGASGIGTIVGQGCSNQSDTRCKNRNAEISFTVESGELRGEIRSSDEEIWALAMRPWDHYYDIPATITRVTGQYVEELASFAADGDTVINVDSDGRLFFQSANSACTGNGAVRPHLDGAVNVFDVVLVIEGCSGSHGGLNGRFEGLATTSPSSYWSYDDLLRIWLARLNHDEPWLAVTMSGRPQ